MAITYHFDLYPRTDPSAARLVRFTNLQAAEYRGEANGSGAGRFSIRATDAQAAFIDPDGLQYVRVVRDDGSTELVVGGFFLESGEYAALTETSTKLLSYGGAGTLSYLGRAVMDADSWINDPFIGTDPQPDGTWPLHLAGTGNELGAILWRVLHELEEPGRHQDPVPLMTLGFTHLLDSNAAAWVVTTGDFVAQVSDTILSIIRRLMQLGLYVEVDPDDFEVRAYEPETHRRDRTGGAWAADVVRFQSPTDGTIATGNIKSDAKRALEAKVRRNALLVGSKDSWLWVDDPGVTVPWEGGYILDDEDGTSLLKAGEAQLSARSEAGDVLRLRMKLGDDEANGAYLPFEHVLLDDLVTVHTGTGQWDYNEAEFPVAALTVALRPGGDWDAWADLGSAFLSMQDRSFQAQPVGSHTHPPNPQLCRPLTSTPAIIEAYGFLPSGTSAGAIAIPAGLTDSILIAFGAWDDNTPFTATYGSALTAVSGSLIDHASADSAMQAFYMLNPPADPSGSGTQLQIADSIPGGAWKGYVVLSGVNQSNPFGSVVTAQGTGTVSAVSIGGSGAFVNAAFAASFSGGSAATDPTLVAGQTEMWSASTGSFLEFAGGFGDATPGWTFGASRPWVALGIAVNGLGSSVGDGHADLIGTSIRAKRCDDTEHYHAAGDPTVNDDTTLGFRNGTMWINESTGDMFLLLDNADGAADWLPVGGGVTDHGALTGLADDDHTQYIKDSEFGAKGRILVGTASGTFDDLPVGTNGDVLTADSGEATGVKWDAVASGSGVDVEDEGTPLATTATTLDFVGAGVTATGAGATKTITIPGGTADITLPDVLQFKEGSNAVTSIVLDAAPTNGNSLILFTNSTTGQVSGVASTNTTWTQVKTHTGTGAYYAIWIGVVGASASATITMTKPGSFNTVSVLEIDDALTPTLGASSSATTAAAVSSLARLTGGTAGVLTIYAHSTDNTTLTTRLHPGLPSTGLFFGIAPVIVTYGITGVQGLYVHNVNSGAGAVLMLDVT